jgi:hypothetical protein
MIRTLKMNYTQTMHPSSRGCEQVPRTFFAMSSKWPGSGANTTQTSDPVKLIFGTLGGERPGPFFSITQCTTSMSYIDAQVFCMSKGSLGKANCGVSSLRKTLLPTDAKDITPLESGRLNYPNTSINHFPQTHIYFTTSFMDLLDDVRSGSGASSVVEWYINDPLTALNRAPMVGFAQIGLLDISVFEQRFSLLWNTLWKIGVEYKSIMGGKMTQHPSYDTLLNTTSHTTFPLPPVYAINVPWMALYFISVAVMFFAAVISLIMRYRCHAPTLLGYVSSLTRDSAHFDNGEMTGNSAESGTQTTKRLRNLRVMVGDTKAGEDVGKIAFVPISVAGRVKRKRWYE